MVRFTREKKQHSKKQNGLLKERRYRKKKKKKNRNMKTKEKEGIENELRILRI